MKYIITLLLSVLFFSCSSSHKITIDSEDRANINFAITNKPSLTTTLNEWSAVQGTETIIDAGEIKKELQKDENLFNINVNNPSKDIFTGNFKVNSIDNLFYSIFDLEEVNGIKTLTIALSMDNYKDLKKSLQFLQEESIEMLGPEANQGVSQEEYIEMMSFSLGDGGVKDLLSSDVELDITVPGDIIKAEGASILSNNRVLVTIPLLDIILLNKKLSYSVTYRE